MGFSLGDAGKGALGGATAGAAFGPLGAGIGAAAGGLLGGIGGMFGGDQAGKEQERLLLALAQESAGRGNPGVSDFRGDQKEHLERLKALYNGTGPSLATEMLRKNTQDAATNQFAMAQSGRGNGAMAVRQALNNAAGISGQAQQQAAQARAAEQLGAAQQIGLTAYGGRGQDQQDENLKLQALANNDRTRLSALTGSLGGAQLAAQQPSFGDQLLALGGGIGQIATLAKPTPQQQAEAAMAKATNQLGTAARNFQMPNAPTPRPVSTSMNNQLARPWYLPGV